MDEKQKVLFSFNMLYDTDMGLIRLISESFRADIFDQSVLDSDDTTILKLLLRRTHVNPISILTQDKSALEYYDQFMNEMYNDILVRSEPTNVIAILQACLSIGGFDVYIQYNNELELEILQRLYSGCTFATREQIDCSDIDILYVKSIPDLIRFRNCNYVNIYLARYGFNVRLDGQGMEVIDSSAAHVLFVTNQCNIIDIYKDISLYETED